MIRRLLKNKRQPIAEIEVTLFQYCPYDCSFCKHDKKDTTGMSLIEMSSKVIVAEQFIVQKMDKDIKEINFQLVGGELLTDSLIEGHYLDIYLQLVSSISNMCKKHGKVAKINIVTSLLFSRSADVLSFISRCNDICETKIIASYDLYGRIVSNVWLKNYELLKDYISINMVVTKQFINELKQGNQFFDKLYLEKDIYLDTFIPDESTSHLIPSDDEYLELLKLVTERYPNLQPYSDVLESIATGESVPMSCMSLNKVTIFPDNSTSNCRWKRYSQSNFKNELKYEDNTNMMKDHLDTYNCLSCQFFKQCPMRCFTQWSWLEREKNNNCVMSEWFLWLKTKEVH